MIELPQQPQGGWRMAGSGGFRAAGGALESEGGPGLLWWPLQSFADFRLRVEWRVRVRTDNSGVFLRLPPLDGDADEALRRAVDEAFEIQIDERGYDPQAEREGSPCMRAARSIASRRRPARPPGASAPGTCSQRSRAGRRSRSA